MKRNKSFLECDNLAGWDATSEVIGDRRLLKYIRPHQTAVANFPMGDLFDVGAPVHLPKTVLATDSSEGPGRGDIYEAFWRTEEMSFRGVFVNSEPTWGQAEYRNGMSYTGMFKGGLPHGFGEKRMGGSVYKGRFENGERHGPGMLFESEHFRLYNGDFYHDKPHGESICILFCWDKNTKRVQHTRSLLHFDHGVLVLSENAPKVDVGVLNGLSPEEFLKMYREGEKALEDKMGRYRLREAGAETVLWKTVGGYIDVDDEVKRPTVGGYIDVDDGVKPPTVWGYIDVDDEGQHPTVAM